MKISQSYDLVVLDYTILFSNISTNLINELKSTEDVVISFDFLNQAVLLLDILDEISIANYHKNIANIKSLKFTTLQKISNGDAFSIVKHHVENDYRVLLVCNNKILEEKIVLSNLPCNIYNSETDKIIYYKDYPSYSLSVEITDNQMLLGEHSVTENSFVYCENGNTIQLSTSLEDEGAEAIVYNVNGNNDQLAKVFKKNDLTLTKINNIRHLKNIKTQINLDWVAFPTGVIYEDSLLKKPVGYTMSKLKNTKSLDSITLFLGRSQSIIREHNTKDYTYALEVALALLKQVMWLNTKGILVTDFNEGNFHLLEENKKFKINFIDTDSFSYENYLSNRQAQDTLSKDYDLSKKIDIIHFSEESMGVLCFKLLTLGVPPLFKKKFRFRADRTNFNNDCKWNLIPDSMQILFKNLFENGNHISVEELVLCISKEINKIKKNTPIPLIKDLLSDYIYENRCEDVGKEFSCTLSNGVDFFLKKDQIFTFQSEQKEIGNVLYFKRNNDNTYLIATEMNNNLQYISVDEYGTTLILSTNATYLQSKWRIEKIGYANSNFFCKIGNEYINDKLLTLSDTGEILFEASNHVKKDKQEFLLSIVDVSNYLSKATMQQSSSSQSSLPNEPITNVPEQKKKSNLFSTLMKIAAVFVVIYFSYNYFMQPNIQLSKVETESGYYLSANSELNGYVEYYFDNGDTYKGDYIDGVISGEGVFSLSNGDVCEGEFIDGSITGIGKYTWASGEIYEGEFLDGTRTGIGKFMWLNGNSYEGEFVDGDMTGYGTFTTADGEVYTGNFIEGKLVD